MPVMLKYRIVCPLTTWMQHVRGYKISDPKNFDHSFVRELIPEIASEDTLWICRGIDIHQLGRGYNTILGEEVGTEIEACIMNFSNAPP